MIEEVLSWVVQLNLKRVVVAQNVSNIILLMYFVQFLTTKRADYMFAFFLCEIGALTGFVSTEYPPEIFAFYMMIYCYLSVVCYARKDGLKLIICCVIMALFELYMIFDAVLYPNVYTFAWDWYADIVLGLHFLFFLSATDFRKALRGISNTLLYVRNAYNHASVMYNIEYVLPRRKRR